MSWWRRIGLTVCVFNIDRSITSSHVTSCSAMAFWSLYIASVTPLLLPPKVVQRWDHFVPPSRDRDVYIEGETLQRRKYRAMKWRYEKTLWGRSREISPIHNNGWDLGPLLQTRDEKTIRTVKTPRVFAFQESQIGEVCRQNDSFHFSRMFRECCWWTNLKGFTLLQDLLCWFLQTATRENQGHLACVDWQNK